MRNRAPISTQATTQLGVQFSVVRLYSWPDLTQLDRKLMPDVARVCALLAIRPTGVPLVHHLLGLTAERARHVIEMLYLMGHLEEDLESSYQTPSEGLEMSSVSLPLETTALSDASSRLLGRLWQRLIGVQDR